jgi:KDO2-lipid IV(A) lauroyltransferase
MPLPAALTVGRGIGWFYGSVMRYHRADAREALALSLPERSPSERRRILRRMYAHLGMNAVELCRLTMTRPEDLIRQIRWEGEEHAPGVLARGKGALALSAHLGNWDLLCALSPKLGYPLTIITKEIRNRGINQWWMDVRQRFGLRFVPAHNSYRTCLAELRHNGVIGFILDQNMTYDEGLFVEFFGRPACTTPGLAYLSAHSGAPVVPVFTLREPEPGVHRVRILPPIEPPPDRKPETILAFTQRYTRIIEGMIRQYPEQWIWIHRRWRTQPGIAMGFPSSAPVLDVPLAAGSQTA